MCFTNIWKLSVPKDRLKALIDKMDTDSDGFVEFGEVRDLVKDYAKAVKRSARYARR